MLRRQGHGICFQERFVGRSNVLRAFVAVFIDHRWHAGNRDELGGVLGLGGPQAGLKSTAYECSEK